MSLGALPFDFSRDAATADFIGPVAHGVQLSNVRDIHDLVRKGSRCGGCV